MRVHAFVAVAVLTLAAVAASLLVNYYFIEPHHTLTIAEAEDVLALFVFAKTAGEMLEGDMREFDEGVLRLLRREDDPRRPVGPRWLVEVATDATALGGATVLMIVLAVVVGYLALERRYAEIALLVVAAAGVALEVDLHFCPERLSRNS